MKIGAFEIAATELAGAVPAWTIEVDGAQWRSVCSHTEASGGRLVALWGSDRGRSETPRFSVHAALVVPAGLLIAALGLADETEPVVSRIFPMVSRMQRAVYDLLGLRASGASDTRQWLRHAVWSEGVFPLRTDFRRNRVDSTAAADAYDDYPFVSV